LTFLPLVHTEEVTGSIPVSPTQLKELLCHARDIALGGIERRYAMARAYLDSPPGCCVTHPRRVVPASGILAMITCSTGCSGWPLPSFLSVVGPAHLQ
jgi:hypothetical protein